jgi:hypothetical protein
MIRLRTRIEACALVLASTLGACSRATPAPASTASSTASAECEMSGVDRALQTAPRASVIILLSERDPSGESLDARQQRILDELGTEFELGRRYAAVAGLAGSISRAGFERARASAAVRCIQLDGTGSGS